MIKIAESGPPINQEDIKALEVLKGKSLPSDYRNFLLSHNGGRPSKTDFSYKSDGEDAGSYIEAFIKLKGEIETIASHFELLKDRIPKDAIPIAHDGCGGLVLLLLDSNAIVFWDHDEEKTYHIANSFTEFLEILKD